MYLPFKIARRYFFSTKSSTAINYISGIAVLGITISTAALILVLSVFNGFEDLITSLYNSFNPDVKIAPASGKVFRPDDAKITQLRALDEVEEVSETLEEIAFFEYNKSQDFGIVKGVDNHFHKVNSIDSTIIRGSYFLKDSTRNYAVLGLGMEYKLSVNIDDVFKTLNIYMPKRKQRPGAFGQPFKKRFVAPAGVFAIQQEFDGQYVLVDLEFAQELLGYRDEVSFLELKLKPGTNPEDAVSKIQDIVGADFEVKNRYQQDEAFYKLMNMEKWMGYAILSFMLFLVAFNMFGALWMLVIEKKKDIKILKSMGATPEVIRNIFLSEGAMLTLTGAIVGFILAIIIFLLQKYFGIIQLQGDGSYVVDAYPVSLRLWDFIKIFFTVMIIGLLFSLLPAYRASRINAVVREE